MIAHQSNMEFSYKYCYGNQYKNFISKTMLIDKLLIDETLNPLSRVLIYKKRDLTFHVILQFIKNNPCQYLISIPFENFFSWYRSRTLAWYGLIFLKRCKALYCSLENFGSIFCSCKSSILVFGNGIVHWKCLSQVNKRRCRTWRKNLPQCHRRIQLVLILNYRSLENQVISKHDLKFGRFNSR